MTDTPPPGLSPEDPLGPLSGVAPASEDGGQTLTFDTTLKPASFLGLSLKNGLLNIVTLTLWRFWGKTEVRRRVWQGIRLNGDAFEYTGRGVELFVGFLLALLVLGIPFLLVIFLAQTQGPLVAPLIILPLEIFLFWLLGFGTFTAWRYMASRTTWRGIRFRLGGSATNFGFLFLGMMLLSGLTLGWYAPTAQRTLAEAIWKSLSFGNRKVRFNMGRSEKEGVYGAFALGWFLTFLPYIALIAAAVTFVVYMQTQGVPTAAPMPQPVPMPESTQMAIIAAIYGVMLLLMPIILLIWAPYQAAILRSVTAGVMIDDATFKLRIKAVSLWWLTVTNLFFLLISLGFLMPWVQARTARYLVQRLEASGTARIDEALQTGTGPKSGEGLADAFGFSLI